MIEKVKLFAICCFLAGGASASPIVITTLAGLGATDSVGWAQLGADQTILGSTFSATSANSAAITGTFANGTGSTVSVVCPASPTCSWVPSGTGFAAGDSLIVTSNASGGATGPLRLGFPSVFGAGLEIQVETPGTFTAEILAFNGASQIATFTEASNGNGDPLFIGVLDTVADISSITVGLSACGGVGCNTNDFAVDTLYLKGGVTGVPEPSVTLLLGVGLVVLGSWKRFRSKNAVRFQ